MTSRRWQGYVWLTCDQHANLGVCATYGAGTILVQNRQQRGDWGTLLVPPPTADSPLSGSSAGAPSLSRSFSTSARALATDQSGLLGDDDKAGPAGPAKKPHGASFADSLFDSSAPPPPSYASGRTTAGKAAHRFSTLYPLLGLQVAERAYLQDYGVWGREAYVRNFWQCVNWSRIASEYERRAQAGVKGSFRNF
ncbi:MAG: hypothetical protein INR71_13130 [Terriglobus roseus]|nr:hypothetical protein [Terriglobus roseus]